MPSIPIQLGDLFTLAAMASKACENMDHFAAGLLLVDKEAETLQILDMQNDCIQILAKLEKQNPGMMPVMHDGETWAERAAKRGRGGEDDQAH